VGPWPLPYLCGSERAKTGRMVGYPPPNHPKVTVEVTVGNWVGQFLSPCAPGTAFPSGALRWRNFGDKPRPVAPVGMGGRRPVGAPRASDWTARPPPCPVDPADFFFALGITGVALAFVRRRLSEGTVLVRVGGRAASEPFRVRVGVTQGDPFSPLAFDLFAEDLHPGSELDVENIGTLSDLKFADDLVVLSDSLCGLDTALFNIQEWCVENGMELNARKCGAMVVFGDEAARAELEAAELQTRTGERIPVVREYRYLGVWVFGP